MIFFFLFLFSFFFSLRRSRRRRRFLYRTRGSSFLLRRERSRDGHCANNECAVSSIFSFFLSLSVRACVCACVETRTVMISGGNDDKKKSNYTLRIGRRRHTPVKKEFHRARARAVFSIPRICDLLEPLSQPLFLSISLIQIRDDDDRKSRE